MNGYLPDFDTVLAERNGTERNGMGGKIGGREKKLFAEVKYKGGFFCLFFFVV